VAVRASSLGPATGRGVFALRDLRIGEALTLYPGALHTSPSVPAIDGAALDAPLPTPPAAAALPLDESYTAMRPDGVLVDAAAVADEAGLARLLASRNGLPAPAACGHILQHGATPNAACVPIDINVLEGHAGGLMPAPGPRGSRARRALPFAFGASRRLRGIGGNDNSDEDDNSNNKDAAAVLPWRLVSRLPYWHVEEGPLSGPLPPLPPSAVDGARRRAVVVPALLIVAAADVRAGEELFIDYALAPLGDPPAWYRAVPVAERWRVYEAVKARAEEAARPSGGAG
jgi:hypothetical protein